ncbi:MULTISPECIES: AraC family transcriptional regulator [unclassified Rathayibacter]|uniref:AraC family transcriptional regulator n=1 Tax=unclassified Rathayibacter TaxID=2609250 RepID=UPI00188CD670|nr:MULTISPECIES: helix-turn-helix domain-containing protein [unclassified Rathayibacter]MBF4461175.1 AraC family transcriptional regulator [Rathayibacter sp. VKM Ac-2879]MBF4502586.1 AraC family transcriptional regulator [Rathayibacter sp. VKM Ac-2878]
MDGQNDQVMRSDVGGRDIEQARALFEESYNGQRFVVEPGENFSYRYTSVGDGAVTLRGSQFAGTVQGSIQTEGEYVVSWLTAGEGATDLTGDPVTLVRGQPAIFVNNRPSAFEFHDYRQNLIHFDGSFLEGVAAEAEGTEPGPLLFDTTARPEGESLRRWSATVATVARVLYDADTSPLLRREADRAIAIALLETFPHVALSDPVDLTVPRGGRLRAAIDYMYAHAHHALSTDDIAEAAGMGLRTLQNEFRRELGLTAVDYLRRIRLDAVHRELTAGETGVVSVSEAARRWGFAHLGRFSASYAHRFGEHPSTTLEGGRSR